VIWIIYDLTLLQVLLGLGSNRGESRAVIRDCLHRLAEDGDVLATSRIWRTRAVGPPQPDFLNAAVLIEWPSEPRVLLARCLEIEIAAGRDRSREERWGPRILDIDLLMADNLVCRGPKLELPHPRLHERRFALEPAAEIAADWIHPLLGLSIGELAEVARRREPNAILDAGSFELRVESRTDQG
jgi:2-amino-4-hydroxy-6-hydroxymethyldihydropteridine diphosphokinase